jgi:hypothetical protein
MIANKTVANAFRRSFRHLERSGLLLLADNKLPSITVFVAGGPVRGSWWGHPKSRDIFHVVCRIADHPDVAVTKLISGKITFVHRKLWPALVAIGMAREPWQMIGLSQKARNLLQIVDRKGEVRTDRLPDSPKAKRSPWRVAIRELEHRLLVYAEEFHSETGAHAKRLESWKHWAARKKHKLTKMQADESKNGLSGILLTMNKKFKAKARLPWMDKG